MAFPHENPVISGGKKVDVKWEPHDTPDEWTVFQDTTTVWGDKADDVHVHDFGKQDDAKACESVCKADSKCTSYTWHDADQGGYANHCWGRIDGQWSPRHQS